MTTYTIDAENNNITVFASLKEIEGSEEGTQTFSNQEELAALAGQWPGARLVEIWNSLPGVEPVERFTNLVRFRCELRRRQPDRVPWFPSYTYRP